MIAVICRLIVSLFLAAGATPRAALADDAPGSPVKLRYPVKLTDPTNEEKRLFGVISIENRQIEFAEGTKVPLIANSEIGWYIHRPGTEPVIVRERYTAPRPASWDDRFKRVDNGSVGIGTWVARPVNGWLSGSRRIAAGDPVGAWKLEIGIDDEPVHTFGFEITDDQATIKSFLRLAKAPNLEQQIYQRAKRECSAIHRGSGLANCILEKMQAIRDLLRFEKKIDPDSPYERRLYKTAYDACTRIYGSGLTSLPCIERWMHNQRTIDELERLYGTGSGRSQKP